MFARRVAGILKTIRPPGGGLMEKLSEEFL